MGDRSDGTCPSGGSIRVVVHDAVPTEAVNIYAGCELDPSTVPAVDEIFDLAIALAGATEFAVELYPDPATPITFRANDRSVSVAGSARSFSTEAQEALIGWEAVNAALDQAAAAWSGEPLADYDLTTTRMCFCPAVGPWTATPLIPL